MTKPSRERRGNRWYSTYITDQDVRYRSGWTFLVFPSSDLSYRCLADDGNRPAKSLPRSQRLAPHPRPRSRNPRSARPPRESPSVHACPPELQNQTVNLISHIQSKKARLALLERGLDVKLEASSATAGLKRERDEESDQAESRQRAKIEHVDLTDDNYLRRRTAVKVEHVDLTGDD